MRTKKENIEIIRKACVAANPQVGNYDVCPCGMSDCQNFRDGRIDAPIRLADVLLAVPHLKPKDHRNIVRGQAESVGNVGFMTVICEWNLRKDDLTEQSDECLTFLADLLTQSK